MNFTKTKSYVIYKNSIQVDTAVDVETATLKIAALRASDPISVIYFVSTTTVTIDPTDTIPLITNPSQSGYTGTLAVSGGTPPFVVSTDVAPLDGAIVFSGLSYAYTPNSGFYGSDTASVIVTDASGVSSRSLEITFNVAQPVPVATSSNIMVTDEVEYSGSLSATNNPTSFSIVTNPINGTVTLVDSSAGTYTYSSHTPYSGEDSFTFAASNSSGTGLPATVSIEVVANVPQISINNQPLTSAGTAVTSPYAITGGTSPYVVTVGSTPTSGSVSIDQTNNNVTYTPNNNFSGEDSFSLVATDSFGSAGTPYVVNVEVAQDTGTSYGPYAFTTPSVASSTTRFSTGTGYCAPISTAMMVQNFTSDGELSRCIRLATALPKQNLTGATITGIQLNLNVYTTNTGSVTLDHAIVCQNIDNNQNGTDITSSIPITGTPSAPQTIVLGGPNNLWGLSSSALVTAITTGSYLNFVGVILGFTNHSPSNHVYVVSGSLQFWATGRTGQPVPPILPTPPPPPPSSTPPNSTPIPAVTPTPSAINGTPSNGASLIANFNGSLDTLQRTINFKSDTRTQAGDQIVVIVNNYQNGRSLQHYATDEAGNLYSRVNQYTGYQGVLYSPRRYGTTTTWVSTVTNPSSTINLQLTCIDLESYNAAQVYVIRGGTFNLKNATTSVTTFSSTTAANTARSVPSSVVTGPAFVVQSLFALDDSSKTPVTITSTTSSSQLRCYNNNWNTVATLQTVAGAVPEWDYTSTNTAPFFSVGLTITLPYNNVIMQVSPIGNGYANPLGPPPDVVLAPTAAPPPATATEPNLVVFGIIDGAQETWYAQVRVSNDATQPYQFVRFVNNDGVTHPDFVGHFYADGCEISVSHHNTSTDYVNCKIAGTYNGTPIVIPPSSYLDGTVAFWVGVRGPMLRYGDMTNNLNPANLDKTLLPNYDWTATPVSPTSTLDDFTFNGIGIGTTPKQGDTGERDSIGMLPQWSTAAAINPTTGNLNRERNASDWDGQWPMFYCDDDGGILSCVKYPNATMMSVAQRSGATITNNPITRYAGTRNGNCLMPPCSAWDWTRCYFNPDIEHTTGYAMLSSMLSKTTRDMDHCSFWANYPIIAANPSYWPNGGFLSSIVRKLAWCIRGLFHASYTSSNTDYFTSQLNTMMQAANAWPTNPEGVFWSKSSAAYTPSGKYKGTKVRGIAIWQQSYLVMVLGTVTKKIPAWSPFANFVTSFFSQTVSSYYAPIITIYGWYCIDENGNYISGLENQLSYTLASHGFSDAQIASITTDKTVLTTYNMIKEVSPTWNGKYVNGVADFDDYLGSPSAYAATAKSCVNIAKDFGLTGADAAYTYIQGLPTPINYTNAEKYHILPWS